VSSETMRRTNVGLLDGKVAVITGGTSGIGATIAELFVAEGANVVVSGRRQDVGETRAERLGPTAAFVKADVCIETDIANLVSQTVERHGRLDCIVNNAGDGGRVGGIAAADVDQFMRTMTVHVCGALLGMKYAAPVMQAQGSGSIVNIASIGGQLAGWTSHDYSAAKAAIIQLSRSVAVELAATGVRVNVVSPGPILTGIFGKTAGIAPDRADAAADALEPIFASRLDQWQPLRDAGRPRHVAPAVLWFASDASAFVTGQNLNVDGGITAGRPIGAAAADRAAMAPVLADLR
jgi:NAD(P)-dependent dehydrogenase (short-subunit alcohol dehydrogenase family)